MLGRAFQIAIFLFGFLNIYSQQIFENQTDSIQADEVNKLDEIILLKKEKSISKSYIKSKNLINISSNELLNAACCNISESFETNPHVDVNFSDALTGNKEISMLGLNSPYILFSEENLPNIRGGSQAFGLTFVPGTWIESIQIIKGMGSVVNDYQSMVGHINVELKKPFDDLPLFVNLFSSLNGKNELNIQLRKKFSEKIYSSFYIHGNNRNLRIDKNYDNFLDSPLTSQINVLNRWQYINKEKGWISFLNIHALKDNKILGSKFYNPKSKNKFKEQWGSEIATFRVQSILKIGYVFPNTPYKSLGLQVLKSIHDQESYFGLRDYSMNHNSNYINLIYNSIITNTMNKLKFGVSFSNDNYEEEVEAFNFNRNDNSFGGFVEYSYDNLDDFSLIFGLRFDSHNRLKNFFTPRIHLRYSPWEKSVFKFSFGQGRKVANIFSENQSLFSSNRIIQIQKNGGPIYGLNPEIAINYGSTFMQRFNLFKKSFSLSIDYYNTKFIDQVVVDYEDPLRVNFYNLEGESFSRSLLFELSFNLANNFDIKLAYKNQKVRIDYISGQLQKPLIPENRVFMNLDYVKKKNNSNLDDFRFNLTLQGIGKQRIPKNYYNPKGMFSKKYFLLNFQISKVFSENIELYSGIENVGNYKQVKPIIAYDDPFGPNFDSTLVYAPIMGRMIYLGFRFNIK